MFTVYGLLFTDDYFIGGSVCCEWHSEWLAKLSSVNRKL